MNALALRARDEAVAHPHRERDRQHDGCADRPRWTGHASADGTDCEDAAVPLNETLHGHRAAEGDAAGSRTGQRKNQGLRR